MSISNPAAALAAVQGGYVTRRQLLDQGMSHSSINRRLGAAGWKIVADGVFRLFVVPGQDAVLRGAVLALPDAVVSHESAARLHGFGLDGQEVASVCVHASTTHTFPGVTVRRCRDLAIHHRTTVAGLPVTNVERTVFDLAACLEVRRLDGLVEDLVMQRHTSLDRLAQMVNEIGRRGKPGTTAIRHVLDQRGSGPIASATRLERLGLEVLRGAGLPAPEIQFSPEWNPRISYDLAFPAARLAIEWDSRRWHTSLERFESDRRRDRSSARHGWQVLRYTWDDLTNRPSQVASEVASILIRRQELAS